VTSYSQQTELAALSGVAEDRLITWVAGLGAFAALHAGYVLLTVTMESVRQAANTYARRLLLCCESLMKGAGPRRARQGGREFVQ
jgi:hypothetical protein